MARWVIHEDAADAIDTEPIMRDIAEDVAADARIAAAKGKTLGLASGITVQEVTDRRAVIHSTARNPRSSEPEQDYPYFVEKGTGRSKARPYLRPAAYRYRT